MNRVTIGASAVCLVVGSVLGWQLKTVSLPPPEPKPSYERIVVLRESSGRREVFARTKDHPEGGWYPVVDRTDSPLAELVPSWLTPGPVVHVNQDGTALITDHDAAFRRKKLDAGGGWPPH